MVTMKAEKSDMTSDMNYETPDNSLRSQNATSILDQPEEKVGCPFCGSGNITTQYDVGSDIDPSGEERQHIDRCECGAWRFHIDRWQDFITFKKHFGKWQPKGDELF